MVWESEREDGRRESGCSRRASLETVIAGGKHSILEKTREREEKGTGGSTTTRVERGNACE